MAVSKLKHSKSVLLALTCIGGATALWAPVMGQSPIARDKDENAKNAAAPQSESDNDKLQGKWQIMSIAIQDQVFKREDKLDAWKATFDKDVAIEGNRLMHAQAAGEGRFKLNDTCDPKQITFQDKDGKLTFQGIYAIDGDALTVCINGDGKAVQRPEKFATQPGTPLLLIALKKVPAK